MGGRGAATSDGTAASRTVHAKGREKLLGHLAMILFALLIAGSFSFGAMTAPHIGAAPLNSIRFAIGAAIIAVIAFGVRREPLRLPPAPWRFLVLGALMGVYFVTMFVALGIALPVSVGAVFTLNPLLAAVFGFFVLGQRARPVVIASLLVAGAGALWVIFRGDVEAMLGLRIGRGEAIFAVGVACHALYAPLFRRFARSEPVVVSTFWVLFFTGICITLYGARDILATDWTSMPAIVWIAISYLAVFATAATFFLVQFASLRLPAAKVFAYGYLTPSFVIVLEGLIGHGWASGAVLAGAVVIVLGLIVLAFAPDG